ncbi:MAG: hypothetical protein ACYTFW_25090, partial [Planctomycetota bacterium]
MGQIEQYTKEHSDFTRRYFLQLGAAGVATLNISRLWAQEHSDEVHPLVAEAISKLEYLTREENFVNAGRGKPPPHKLPLEKRREVGLVRDTWQLEVLPDPESDSKVERPLSKALGTA